jgi:aspartyl-tRNA(Asn)/glutamyl-tRNA(Gln) amidotransferase subunit C
MTEGFTRAEVQRIAELASLELDDQEEQAFARQIADVLSYVDALRRVDTTGVTPTAHAGASGPRERDDEPRPCLAREDALRAAPNGDPEAGLFKVPRVIG